jgi:hypothetical protein
MPPVIVKREGTGWKITGGFDLAAFLGDPSALDVGGTVYEMKRASRW